MLVKNYRESLSSGRWHVEDLVLTHVAFSRLPLDIQGTGGGVGDPEVPDATQRFCRTARKVQCGQHKQRIEAEI